MGYSVWPQISDWACKLSSKVFPEFKKETFYFFQRPFIGPEVFLQPQLLLVPFRQNAGLRDFHIGLIFPSRKQQPSNLVVYPLVWHDHMTAQKNPSMLTFGPDTNEWCHSGYVLLLYAVSGYHNLF